MEYLVGLVFALAVSVFATYVGFGRERGFYPTVMIVIALLYGLFAAIGGLGNTSPIEFVAMAGFIVAAVLGYTRNLWLVAAALCAHGIYDLFHGSLVANPGVPVWWPMFCFAYDVTAGAYLAWLLLRSRINVKPLASP